MNTTIILAALETGTLINPANCVAFHFEIEFINRLPEHRPSLLITVAGE